MSQRFQSPFGRHSTASEVIDGVDLSGKRAIVTGAVVTRRTADYTGVAWYAVDQANAERLWDTALNLLSIGDPPST